MKEIEKKIKRKVTYFYWFILVSYWTLILKRGESLFREEKKLVKAIDFVRN